MKKRLYTLVITFCVLLVLGIGIWILVLQPAAEDETDDDTLSIGITGYENDSDQVTNDVSKLTIINQYGQINLTPIPRTTDATASSAKWLIEEMGNAESGDWSANDMALAFYIIEATGKIDVETSNLTAYGLDTPDSVVRIAFADGNTHEYRFGDQLSISGDTICYYVMRDDDPSVYVVEDYYFEKAQVQLKDVVNYTMLEEIDDIALVSKTIIYGAGYKERIEIEPIPDGERSDLITATHRFVLPALREMPTESSANLFNSLSGISASSVAAAAKDKLPDSVLAEYGLDNPTRIVTFNNNGTVHTLKAGNANGTDVYILLDDVPMVYVLPMSTITYWYNADFDTMAYRIMYAIAIADVKTITFKTEGKTYEFKVTTDESDEVIGVTLNGVKATVATYKALFTEFVGMAYKERDAATYSAAADMTIHVTKESGTTDTIELIPANARRHMYVKNGEGGFLISYESVNDLRTLLIAAEKSTIN